MAQPLSAFAEVRGIRLHYLGWGDAPRTVVCLHGTSMHAHGWARLAADLQPDYRVIALDMRGHGLSDRPRGPGYTIATYRDDLAAFVDAIGLKTFCLVGSSLGTQVAIAYTAHHPSRVEKLLLSDPSCTIVQSSIDQYLHYHRVRPRVFDTYDDALAYSYKLPQRARMPDDMHRLTVQGDVVRRPDGKWEWAYDLDAILETFSNLVIDQWPEVRATTCPTLILRGEESHVLSRPNAERLGREFPDARLIEIKDCSHMIWGDKPAELSRLAREFFAA